MEIFKLFGSIMIDNDKANDSLSKTEKKADGVGKKFLDGAKTVGKWGLAAAGAAVTVGTAMFAMASKAGDAADRLLDLKAITGMSTDEIQRWEKVTKIAGVSADAMTNASKKLTKSLDTMINSGGKGAESLEALGLTVDEIANMNADERMNAITKALAELPPEADRAKIGTDLLGGAWADIAPIVDMGTEAMQKAKDSANIVSEEDLNKANDFRIKVAELKDQFGFFFMMLSINVIPILQTFMDWISQYMPQIKETSEQVFDAIVIVLGELVSAIKDTTNWFKDHWGIVEPILIGIGAGVATFYLITGAIAAYGAITKAVTLLQLLFNGALLANPIGIVIGVVMLLVAAGVALYKNWDVVTEKLGNFWGSIKSVFGNIKDFVLGVFGDMAGGVKKFINSIIGAMNSMITGLNNISFKVPDWVPVIGGKGWNFNLPKIPSYAKGTDFHPGGMALVGEEGPELVNLPRGSSVKTAGETAGMMGTTINITVQGNIDRDLYDDIMRRQKNDYDINLALSGVR